LSVARVSRVKKSPAETTESKPESDETWTSYFAAPATAPHLRTGRAWTVASFAGAASEGRVTAFAWAAKMKKKMALNARAARLVLLPSRCIEPPNACVVLPQLRGRRLPYPLTVRQPCAGSHPPAG